MKIKPIRQLEYQPGDETQLKKIVYRSKEPILIKIKNFTNEFSLDYFEQKINAQTTYLTYHNDRFISIQPGDFKTVIAEIKQNKPYKIFGQMLSRRESIAIERHVPLWQRIPLRPRYFNLLGKVIYFFGGQGAHSVMHFDREHCCNFHLCLSGQKELLLFTKDQSEYLYKVPYIGDSLIDFAQPLAAIRKKFPRFNQAEGYRVVLEKGDMLFMPRNCWHFTRYWSPSSAAGYVFYPQKILQLYGYFTGHFYLAYRESTGLRLSKWPIVENFSRFYALSEGKKKALLNIFEHISYVFLLPIVSIFSIVSLKLRPRRLY
jgi:hypothetical protein